MRQRAAICLALSLLPAAARAGQPSADATQAKALGARQAAAAASIRGLEDATAAAGTQLANLQAAQVQSQARLAKAEADLARLLPIMRRLSSAPASTLLAAPLPPGGAVQGVALLRGVAQAIANQARTVQTENAQLAQLIAAAKAKQAQLEQAAAAQAAAEAKVAAQIQAERAAEMAAAAKVAVQIAARMNAQKPDSLNDAVHDLVPNAAKPASLTAGAGGAPVAGNIVQAFGAPTPAGPAVGISYSAAPGALVTSPCAGTVMFANAFPSYGLMVIADCGHGDSVILAGMSKLDVAQGEHLVHGQPVGTMQPFDPHDPTHQPRLYVELRQNGTPVDPAPWLNGGHSG